MSADNTANATDAQHATDYTVSVLQEADDLLSDLSQADLTAMDDGDLEALREATKNVEDTAEDARKDAVDAEIEARDGVAEMTVVNSHRKYVDVPERYDGEIGLVMALVSQGIDPSTVIDVNASALAELLADTDADVGDPVGRSSVKYILG